MPGDLDILWTDGTLLAATTGVVASGFVDVRTHEWLRVSRTVTGGTYVFEIDWSRDGGTVDFTQVVTTTEKDVVQVNTACTFARFRVRNTGTVFTAHRTNVFGWG